MDLSKYKLLHHDQDQFVVHDGEKSFAIAKKHIGSVLTKKIEQHFWTGDEVKAAGDIVAPPMDGPVAPDTEPPAAAPAADMTDDRIAWLRDRGLSGDSARNIAENVLNKPGNIDQTRQELFARGASPDATNEILKTMYPPLVTTPERPVTPTAAQVAPSPTPTPAAPAPQLNLPAFPGAPSTAGLSMEEQGIKAGAEAAGKQSQAETGVLDADEKASRAAFADLQAHMKPLMIQHEQLAKDIMSSKIDPNRLWHNSSTGQKVTASIGMILGGIGAGLTGGPNQAVHIIDQAIQRDVDAQKEDLGKKQSLLADNLRQTQDLRSSYDLRRAHGLDVASIQMRKAAAQFGDERAKASALAAAGLLEQKRDDIMRGYTLQKYQDSYQKAVAQYTLQQQGQSAALMDAASRGLSPEDFAKLPPEHPLRKAGIPIAEDEAVTRNGKPVLDQDGNPVMHKAQRFYQAVNDKIVEKALPEFANNSETLDKVRNLKAFAAEHKSGAWSPKAIQEAQALANDVKLSWLKAQEGVGRMNENEKDMLDQMVQDPSKFFASATGKTDQSVKSLERSVLTKREALKNTYLIRRNQ